MRGVAGEPIAAPLPAASLTERLQSCTARGTRLACWRLGKLVSPLSHAFSFWSCLRLHACTSTVRGRAPLRERHVPGLRRAALSIHHPGWRASHGSKPWAPLGMLAGTRQAIRPVLIYCFGCCSLVLFCFLPFSSHLIPPLIPCCCFLSEHWLLVSGRFYFLFKSILNISLDTFCCRSPPSSIFALHLQTPSKQLIPYTSISPTSQCLPPKSTATWPAMSNPLSYRYAWDICSLSRNLQGELASYLA